MSNKVLMIALLMLCNYQLVDAQELYVFTEPASNMPSKSLAVRISNEGMINPGLRSRTIPELMVGLNKNLMFHLQGFASDMDGGYKFEGGSLYAKYRFLSLDGEQSHSRAAFYGRISSSNRSTFTQDINLEGDVSGWQAGIIATQLVHKLALSTTLGYNRAFNREDKQVLDADRPNEILNYSLSSGYLLLPFKYVNYNQPNFNLYVEFLGKTNPANGNSYLDMAPAVQLILNSKTRMDLGYRFQLAGNMNNRYLKNMYFLRVEFNFFNILR